LRDGRVAVEPVAGKGLGVRLREPVAAGEPLAVAAVFELAPEDVPLIERTAFRHHYFVHPERDGEGVIVLGWLTFCNHDADPSLTLDWQRAPFGLWTVTVRAARALAAGEELTIDYNCELWFEARP
jgi:hypothetical protein